MDVEFADPELDRLEADLAFTGGWPKAIVQAFRKRMQFIRAAVDERAFYPMRSLHFEKLKGKRSHQYSMRLNDQWRLILEIKPSSPKNIIVAVGVEDYH